MLHQVLSVRISVGRRRETSRCHLSFPLVRAALSHLSDHVQPTPPSSWKSWRRSRGQAGTLNHGLLPVVPVALGSDPSSCLADDFYLRGSSHGEDEDVRRCW